MRVALLILFASLTVACGSEADIEGVAGGTTDASDASDAMDSSSDATDQDAGPVECPSGHISGPDGECMAVGIQGCDAMFIDPETGMCDPSLVECPPGQIPIFGGDDQGCRAVGIVDCHPEFLDVQTGRCDPAPDACPEGSMAIPTQGCVSLDPPGGCGDGAWGNIEELPGDVHMDVNYTGDDSDGTRERPWTLYGYASGKVQSGGRIVLAAGDYDQGMLVSKSISLVGRCSSMVTLSGVREGAGGPTVLEVKGDVEVVISDLTVSGPGYGFVVRSGAKLSLSRASLKDNHTAGILAHDSGTSVTASEVWISDTKMNAEGLEGFGVAVGLGASVSLSRSRVSECHGSGIAAFNSGTSVTASEVWVSGTKIDGEGKYGYGFQTSSGASLSVSRSRVSECPLAGLIAFDSGTIVTASEVWVSGMKVDSEGKYGPGVVALYGASVSVSRSRVSDNHLAGLMALNSGTSLTATQVWVSGTKMDAEGLFGVGVAAGLGASVSVSRSRVSDNHTVGLFFYEAEGSVSESFLEGTKPSGVQLGDGLLATGSVVNVQRVISRDNARAGVLFDKSDGEVSGSLITRNAIGLADQGLPGATVADDNVIEGNDQDRLDDGNLEVPDEAMSLPGL